MHTKCARWRKVQVALLCVSWVLFANCEGIAMQASLESPQGPSIGSGAPPDAAAPAKASDAAAPPHGRPDPAPGNPAIRPVQTTVEVNAGEQTLRTGLAVPHYITQAEVLSSAGTWQDFTRYLQVLPGVVWNSDMSNDLLVRGGQPSENLYVVDGIEVPNINHISVEGTTGGFTSMIDTAAVGNVEMKAGVYDARFSSRLSSLIDIHTRENRGRARDGEIDLGIAGVGGFVERPLGANGNLMLSGHRSVLNLFTNDIGLNGVPIYTNGLARLDWAPGGKDRLSVLSLTGADSIAVTPAPCDGAVTLPVQTQYGGFRSTDGFSWQHVHSPAVVSTLTASYSTQSQDIGQQLQHQTEDLINLPICYTLPYQTTRVYQEQTRDSTPSLAYGLQFDRGGWFFSAGATGRVAVMNYSIDQPLGHQSPFSADPAWVDAGGFDRDIAMGQSGAYAEATGHLGSRWTIIAGAREETFALSRAHLFEPRASVAFRLSERHSINASYGRSSQMAPSVNILSYAQNAALLPIHVSQFSLGADLWRTDRLTLSAEAYDKRYADEPVSTEYPSLMLANMVDMLGQQFIWLPLKTGGRGRADGLELMLRAHLASRYQFLGSATYSRTMYAASDGVMRPGNYDFPLVMNGLASARLSRSVQISVRDTYASGRPYTPFDVNLSEQQFRGIYDLSRVNAQRGPAYNRLDIDLNRSFRIRGGLLNVNLGAENALDRANFMGYVWMGNCPVAYWGDCGPSARAVPGLPETTVIQMPIFPSAGLRYSF